MKLITSVKKRDKISCLFHDLLDPETWEAPGRVHVFFVPTRPRVLLNVVKHGTSNGKKEMLESLTDFAVGLVFIFESWLKLEVETNPKDCEDGILFALRYHHLLFY